MSTIIWLIFYSLVGGLFSLIGALLLAWQYEKAQRLIVPLLSFAAGAFLGASFLDLLPEALTDNPAQPIMAALLVGFVGFFAAERLLMRYLHYHGETETHKDHTESLPYLVVAGDSVHNFIDGLAIGLSFLANPSLGLITTLAVSAHEIPQEMGDFTILLNLGWSKKKVIAINILQSLLTVPGALIGYYVGSLVQPSLPYLLAGTAGTFIYIAASDLIPEIHHQAAHRYVYRVVIACTVGILAVWFLSTLAGA